MILRLRRRALADVEGAITWYSQQGSTLGERFLADFNRVLSWVEENPFLYAERYRGVRRAGFPDFPYGLFFRVQGQNIDVIAVTADARNPAVWQRRS